MRYTGKTKLALQRRMALHRAHIVNETEGPAMLEHFTRVHNPGSVKIKGIQLGTESNLTKIESDWRMELGMAFPYSLNDRISVGGIQDCIPMY